MPCATRFGCWRDVKVTAKESRDENESNKWEWCNWGILRHCELAKSIPGEEDSIKFVSSTCSHKTQKPTRILLLIKFPYLIVSRRSFILNTQEKLAKQLQSGAFLMKSFHPQSSGRTFLTSWKALKMCWLCLSLTVEWKIVSHKKADLASKLWLLWMCFLK